tara:strand:+ start:34 stop:204 length:171 start_codon:yes stop_codon:yes gene_type:complete
MICKHHADEMSWCMICWLESIGLDYDKLKYDFIKSSESDYFMQKFQKKKDNGNYDL